MTMETSDEVSWCQEVKEKLSVIIIKERERAVLACVSNQAQNAHFLTPSITITQLLKMTTETAEEVSTGQEVI